MKGILRPTLLGILSLACLLIILIDGIPKGGLAEAAVGGIMGISIIMLLIDRILALTIKSWKTLLIVELLLLVAVYFIIQ